MNWNLFWALFTLPFALACWICAYFFGFRALKKKERCSMHTLGTITRYSAVTYAGIHLPVAEYLVNGKLYKIAGPKFTSVTVRSVSTPFANPITQFETNLTTRENLPRSLKIKVHKNSFIRIQESPLNRLYPLNSTVDVYYNPRKPKEAFIQRDAGVCTWLIVMLVISAVLCTAGFFIFLFGPEIVMH